MTSQIYPPKGDVAAASAPTEIVALPTYLTGVVVVVEDTPLTAIVILLLDV